MGEGSTKTDGIKGATMSLSDRIRNRAKAALSANTRGTPEQSGSFPQKNPLWRGPEEDGVTQSLLSRFLSCRERFRLLVVEGLRPAATFNHRIEYGNMWHVCEEALATGANDPTDSWEYKLKTYTGSLCRIYSTQQEQIDHWYNVCRVQFPLYVEYWSRHSDVRNRTPLLQEQVFDVPYRLPSGRTVRLRGKWDSVDLVGKGKNAGIWLQENKTKADINETQMKRQLSFDLQTMFYMVSLQAVRDDLKDAIQDHCSQEGEGVSRYEAYRLWPQLARDLLLEPALVPVSGVRYNVIRRPLSGGKGSIVRHKPTKSNPQGETKAHYYSRLSDIIKEDLPYFFMRWQVTVTPADLAKFKREFLDPILEQLCDWWQYIEHQTAARNDPFAGYTRLGGSWECPHWRHPFGAVNWLDEGGSSDLDAYMESGSEVGLVKAETLFGELE
jgi:hypothetical protein